MPTIGTIVVTLDKATCIATITCDIEMLCGDGEHKARLYKRKENNPALVPTEQVLPEQTLAAGPATRVVSWTTKMTSSGIWHFTVAVYENGTLKTSKVTTFKVVGCRVGIPPIIEGLAVPHEGVDELIYLVKVTHPDPATWVYTKVRVLSGSYQMLDWWYLRNGGCGNFRLLLRETFPEADISLQDGWEIHIDIKLAGETAFTTWYRGVIRAVDIGRQANEILTEVRGQGYVEQLASIQIQRRYPKGITIESVVKDIITNTVVPNSRILNNATADNGVDTSSYILAGPIHFECSTLKAIKFLSELQGNREFGVNSNRQFYFRTKKEVIQHGIFAGDDSSNVVDVVEGGKEVDKINQLKIAQKQWGHKEEVTIIKDYTDISNYGLYEKPIDVPWVEHRQDAQRWAKNLIDKKIDFGEWRKIAWSQIDKRLEEDHPSAGLDMVRIYGSDVSNEFIDLDINRIHYYKGGFVNKGEVKEIHRPKTASLIDQPVLRAYVYCGPYHKDFIEQLEEIVIEPIAAIKGKDKQFRNPRVDVTNPDVNEIDTQPAQLWAQPKISDVTHGPFVIRFRDDLTNWPALVKLRFGDVSRLPSSGDFLGEEFFLYENPPSRTHGTKYYWNGIAWVAILSGNILYDREGKAWVQPSGKPVLWTDFN